MFARMAEDQLDPDDSSLEPMACPARPDQPLELVRLDPYELVHTLIAPKGEKLPT